MSKGLFITLEGVEGTGKSTFTALLLLDLSNLGLDVISTREPGGSSIGPTIRSLLLDPNLQALDPRAEALLFAADRAQHVSELIAPALLNGKIVLCDRYIDSSVAYQGMARRLGVNEIRNLSLWGTQDCIPDLTILIDIDPEISLGRKTGDEVNRMENQEMLFHKSVRSGLLALADLEPDRFVKVDGSKKLEQVYAQVKKTILTKLLEQEDANLKEKISKALEELEKEMSDNF